MGRIKAATDLKAHAESKGIRLKKNGKDRIIPIGKITCRYLENYIKCVRPALIREPGNDYLFLSLRSRQLSKNIVWDLVKKYAKKARIKKMFIPIRSAHLCDRHVKEQG
ncbi:MAG: tyrosine-type recombinase/integrase [Proteobacteria bacterium]|nr:tyrosine-type recombinase/integrase [Pseudomonadota bacterium]MBU1581568.1 tyrosine-type recombinase/integrase [Pseudomonadota bacterium]MBU2453870.1 tyrosine-type recombinase/integrase [Pseudomonadota bacterium]